MPFFQQPEIQRAMERILYIWSIRHPASGYVQGMNDLLTPLLLVATQQHATACTGIPAVLRCDVATLEPAALMHVEADAYWCLTKLMDNIQDHYTFDQVRPWRDVGGGARAPCSLLSRWSPSPPPFSCRQPGVQRMVRRLEDLVHRLDTELHGHFEEQGVQYIQFSFRWMNCLLLRELPLRAIIRVWDTYLSEERGGFENFHVYVCAVILKTYKDKLMSMDFQAILMFLQDMPTQEWGESDVECILSQAYILSTLFDDSPSHLN